jgi:subtilisin family serine protease
MARAAVMAEGAVTEREIPEIGVLVLRTPPGQQSIVEKRLRESKRFRSVEPNYLVWLNEMPDDPLYEQQWGLQAVAAPLAWDSVRGDGVTIAVVDTGIDSTHPDLSARVVAGLNTITESLDTADDHGHGTSIAGIAGAAGFNAVGIIGVAPEAQLMPVKSLNAAGYGTYADVAQGIVYATDHGARVINLSLGGEVDSTTLSSAVEYAVSRGVVVVAAAGNLGSSGPMYPAAYPDVIAVGATDVQDARASFSNFGPWLDLVAPGVDITTTSLGGFYGDLSGTSPAAPFVAGAAALVLAANPTLQPHQVASVLDLASEDRGSPGFDTYYGWGRLNVARAVEQAIALSQTPDAGAPAVRLVAPEDGASVAGVVALSVEASDDVSVVRVEYSAGGIVVASATQPPFTAQWDTQLVPAGAHLLGATAYDAYGNRGLAPSISVEVAGNEMACSTPGGICLPGGGAPAVDCFAEWFVVGDDIDEQTGRKSPVVTITPL